MDDTEDTMRGRGSGSGLRLWLLLEADRRAVAALPLAVVFGSLVVLASVDPVPLRRAVAVSDPVETLFQALVAAIVTGVTLVVTINQVVLSQELGAVGDQRERMAAAMAYRREVEEVLGSPVSPPEPAGFLRALIEATRDRAVALGEAVEAEADPELRTRTADFVGDVVEHADAVTDRLDGAQFGTFGVVSAALDFDYSRKVHETRRLEGEHAAEVGEEAAAAFGDLLEALELYGSAREHVKTLYFQWALIDLSRSISYAAVPALVVAVAAILTLGDPGTVTGGTLGVDNFVWVVSAAVAVALLPFAVLLSYVLRVATVAKRTLAIGPFILRESAREGGRG